MDRWRLRSLGQILKEPMTPAHSRCFPGAKSDRRTTCGPNPTSARPPVPQVTSALVASAEANPTGVTSAKPNPTGVRLTTARSRCFPGAKSPAHGRPRLDSQRLQSPRCWLQFTRPPAPSVTSALAAIQPAHSPTIKVVPAIQPAFGHFPASGACTVRCTLETRPPAVCGKLGKARRA